MEGTFHLLSAEDAGKGEQQRDILYIDMCVCVCGKIPVELV